MRNGADLATYVVVQAIERIGVDEAVAHPAASLDSLAYFIENLSKEIVKRMKLPQYRKLAKQ